MSDTVEIGGGRESMDAPQTIKLKRQDVKFLDELRNTDPQGAIDSVFDRKEKWKQTANYHFKRANEAEKSGLAWKKQCKKETQMKNRWKLACIATWGGALTILVLFLAISQLVAFLMPKNHNEIPKTIPTSGQAQRTPTQVLASVNILNGSTQGSGTIISKGEKYGALLSAAHNFVGKIGGNFWVYYPDGSYTKATLLAVDRERDLALARVEASSILATSYVPRQLTQGFLSGVGYTNGQGPMFRNLAYTSGYKNFNGCSIWNFNVSSGPFSSGDSGGGIFIDDGLIAVTTQRNASACSNQLYACSHPDIIQFLDTYQPLIQDCGEWSIRPVIQVPFEESPPLWRPNSNIPLVVDNNVGRLLSELQADVETIKAKLNATDLKRPSDVPNDKKSPGLKRPSDIPS